jgi:hypothetical protein
VAKRKAQATTGPTGCTRGCWRCHGENTIAGPTVTRDRGRGPEQFHTRIKCPGPNVQTSAPIVEVPPARPATPPLTVGSGETVRQPELFDHRKAAAGDREDLA